MDFKVFFKAVLFGDSTLSYAYLVPQPRLAMPYGNYIITINELEELVNLDLYQGLEEMIESLIQ